MCQHYFRYPAVDKDGGMATTNVSVMIMAWALDDVEQTAEITFPTNNTQVTAPIEVIGSVDSQYLRSWRLQYSRVGFPWRPFRTFLESDEAVTNGVLGTFDPTGLPNGQYYIRLVVEDWPEFSSKSIFACRCTPVHANACTHVQSLGASQKHVRGFAVRRVSAWRSI